MYSKFYIIIEVSLNNLLMSNYKLYKDLDYMKNFRLIGFCMFTMGHYKICDSRIVSVFWRTTPLMLW